MTAEALPLPRDNRLAAAGWMLGHVLAFGLSAGLIKGLSDTIPIFEQVAFRAGSSALLTFVVVRAMRTPFIPAIWPILLFRGLAGFGGVALMYWSLRLLPLTIAMLLTWTTPVFVALGSRLFLGEKLSGRTLACMITAFSGLGLTVGTPSGVSDVTPFGVMIGVLAAASSGLAFIAVRKATASVGPNLIVFYFSFVTMALALPVAIPTSVMPDGPHAAGLALLCLLSLASDQCKTRAYQYAAAGIVSTMALFAVAVSAVIGWAFFGELLSAPQWAGVAVLSGAITVMSLPRRKAE